MLCNAVTGECTDYAVKDVPSWVDRVYSADLLVQLYDYYGSLKHGFINSVLGQKDCLTTTNGYNYLAMNDDVWVYTGVTSITSDQSNVGFVLMNERTMETKYYQVEGAIEDSAMSSAEWCESHIMTNKDMESKIISYVKEWTQVDDIENIIVGSFHWPADDSYSIFDNELVVESKWSNQGLLDALIDLETEDGDEYFVAFDYVVDNQDMLSNVKWGKYIIGDLFEG